MVEMLVVMIISGIVIGLTFEAVDIFRRYSRKITNEILSGNDLLNNYLSLNTIVGKSDSLTINNHIVTLHRRGAVFGELYLEDSMLFVAFSNTVDTMPLKAKELNVKRGVRTDTLIIETEIVTMLFNTAEQAVIATKKNIYNEDQND